jgi:hypothetical protein
MSQLPTFSKKMLCHGTKLITAMIIFLVQTRGYFSRGEKPCFKKTNVSSTEFFVI